MRLNMYNKPKKLSVAIFYDFSLFQEEIAHYLEKETKGSNIEITFYHTMPTLFNAIENDRVNLLFTEFAFLSNNKTWLANSKKFNRLCIERNIKRAILVANQHPYLLRHIIDMKFEATISVDEGLAGIRRIIELIQYRENIPFISKNLMQIVDETDDRQCPLTPKEWEVLYLVAQGCSISDIAGRKNKSNSTVATQKQNAMKKLNLSSNSELIKYMYVTGMME